MLTFTFENREVTKEERKHAVDVFDAYNDTKNAPAYKKEFFTLLVKNDDVQIGGIIGSVVWDWMYIELLWLEESHRNADIGTQLMQRAEAAARAQKLVGIYLYTQSWQAPGFYIKMGYEQFAEMADFPRGHTKIYFRKILKDA